MATSCRPSFSYFTAHWGVRRRMTGFSHHTLLIPKNFEQGFEQLYGKRRLPDEPIVYLNVASEIDPGSAPPGCTNLFAVVTSPACEDGLDWESLSDVALGRVKSTLAKFGWELSDSELDFERVQTPVYFASQQGNYRGSLYGCRRVVPALWFTARKVPGRAVFQSVLLRRLRSNRGQGFPWSL